jgi:alpha-L-fucosidase 2
MRRHIVRRVCAAAGKTAGVLPVLFASFAAPAMAESSRTYDLVQKGKDVSAENRPHVLELQERVLTPEDGLLLGNGDLSVSVYQTADRIIWRFGKSDVWDRRIDRSDDPKPARIDEVAHGIRVERWKCPPYGGPVEATRGTKDPKRMKEVCQAVPPSYRERPYPCPKPVGELAMQLPPDQTGLRIRQRLLIEEARLEIECSWQSGVSLRVDCFVPPADNVLVVSWKAENWTPLTRTGNGLPPVWFSLYRWADPPIRAFAQRFFGDYRHGAFMTMASPKATPLPPPAIRQEEGISCIAQSFPADPTFPQGFECLMAPFAADMTVEKVDTGTTGEARLHLMPRVEATGGNLIVAVTTTSDEGGAGAELRRLRAKIGSNPADALKRWENENRSRSAEFWSKSRVAIADPLLENLWFETLHARRCTNRADRYPPGLFLPSTVQDYSHWHGDYHTNYNLQEPFWGDYTANHLELGDAYFQAMEPLLEVGRKIARDYYNARGAFVQLSGYPALMEDDPLGCVPMGRMAYMTGWAMNQYWWRYLYTRDEEWLRKTGYPAIRDCALFYTDFLKRGEDGLYHAFPSNQGEDGFTGNPKDYTDRAQVMRHMRYCLRAAIRASEILKADPGLRAQWRDRLEHSAGDDGSPLPKLTGQEKVCYEANPPEFGDGRPYRLQPAKAEGKPWPPLEEFTWYFGQLPWFVMQSLRAGNFVAEKDMPAFRALVERWRHPNGLLWGMAVANYGHAGAWTETLGVLAPLQEMMLQSWDGTLRVFPAWPKALDAWFDTFRAEGAFLVSAGWSAGRITRLEIVSEKGGPCRIVDPWPEGAIVRGKDGRAVEARRQEGAIRFETEPGGVYRLEPAR